MTSKAANVAAGWAGVKTPAWWVPWNGTRSVFPGPATVVPAATPSATRVALIAVPAAPAVSPLMKLRRLLAMAAFQLALRSVTCCPACVTF